MKTNPALQLPITAAVMALALFANASFAENIGADDIARAVSDKTYQGSMTDSAFAEYYGADGSIRGKDYSGKWRTEDNRMCFQYGDSEENCWDVSINGPALTLIKDGKVDGSGMLVNGNPQQF